MVIALQSNLPPLLFTRPIRAQWLPMRPVATFGLILANTYSNITPERHSALLQAQKKQARWLFAFLACLVLLWSMYSLLTEQAVSVATLK